jgi:succinate dehydrogenase / fumarate reductase flavoprotein subunit
MLAHNKLGPIRQERTLGEALAEFERIEREDMPAMRLHDKARTSDKVRVDELESALSVRSLTLLGRVLATACLKRTESRGAHFRLDCPSTDDVRWRVTTRIQLGANEKFEFYTDPVKKSGSSHIGGELMLTK